MKTLPLHLSALVLLCFSSWASAAWYLSCPSSQANATVCITSSWQWHAVGTYPPSGRSYYGNSSGTCPTAGSLYFSNTFAGVVTNSWQCATEPANGSACPVTGVCTSMTVASPISCVPSGRTIEPCPSGYAPSAVVGNTSTVGDSYSSAFEKLPIQDLLYGIGIALCGLIGVGVGTRLI